jgi:aminoglycoside phosphotransferase (APT) family kinase protein
VLTPQKYSERLGVIEPEQLQEVAERFELGEVLDAYSPTGGLFGQNLILETRGGRFVLRGNPHGHVQLMKERHVAEFIHHSSSLAAPWPYKVCDDASLFGWTYAVMPCLPGTSGTELWQSADEAGRVALSRATGDALAALHEAESDFCGPYDAQADGFIAVDDFADWCLHRLDHWRNACRSVNALSTEAERYIDDVLEQCADGLDESFTPVLVHHDFKFGNLNFEAGGGFRPTGVFDLFEAYVGDGEEDLVRMLWLVQTDQQRHAFLDAYASRRPLRPGASQRLAIYALADWLVIWEYGRRVGTFFEESASFVETARPVVDRAGAVGSRWARGRFSPKGRR